MLSYRTLTKEEMKLENEKRRNTRIQKPAPPELVLTAQNAREYLLRLCFDWTADTRLSSGSKQLSDYVQKVN